MPDEFEAVLVIVVVGLVVVAVGFVLEAKTGPGKAGSRNLHA